MTALGQKRTLGRANDACDCEFNRFRGRSRGELKDQEGQQVAPVWDTGQASGRCGGR